MKQYSLSRSNQGGFSLIEALVVLVIGVIVLAAASGSIGGIFTAQDKSQEVSHVVSLLSNTKSLRSSGGYGVAGTDLVPPLIANKAVPTTMSVIAGKLTNAWGGTIAVASTGGGISITESALPADACIEISTKISRGGAVTTKIGANAAVVGEVTQTDATTQCADPTSNTVVFTTLN